MPCPNWRSTAWGNCISPWRAAVLLWTPTPPTYEIDLSFLHQYETRSLFERYGCVAVFGADQTILGVYWCHGDKLGLPVDPQSSSEDASTEWEHAKYVFKSSLLPATTLKDHLVHLH